MMKQTLFKSLKTLSLLMLLVLFLIPQNHEAQNRKKKKKDDNSESVQKSAAKDKEKSIKELVKSSREIDGLFKIYQDTIKGTIQMLVSKDQIGKEFIYFSQIGNGVIDAGGFRGAYTGSKVFKIEKYFNNLEFITQNTSFYFNPGSPLLKSKEANISNGNMASIEIEAYDKEKGIYLIKADNLFLSETLSQIKRPSRPGASPTAFKLGSLDKSKTKINSIRNYDKNTDLAVEYVYSSPSVLNGGSNAVTDGRNVSIQVYHSLIAMPENNYEPRFDDQRVGYFTTQVEDQTSTNSAPYRDLIHRWNLVKKNPEAAISEPVEPITWWIENSTPFEWRETIKSAVLQWNVAFEKAGFKNAMVVKVQPDDATWDAGDIRYNVLRWTSSPNPPFGGYGPSFVNPKTGEILGADVMLEFVHFTNRVLYDKVFELASIDKPFDNSVDYKSEKYCSLGEELHQEVMFANAVASATGASAIEVERIKKESMMALIMHEVGHTLGLNHNMKASQLYSPEQLDNADFIEGKCLTASVMDYAALNITKDRSKQGQYDDVAVGPYDVWAIQLGYTPFKSEDDRQALLNESTKPEHIFGNDADDMRSPGKAIDPRVNVSDQSNDQIKWAVDRIELSNNLMTDTKSRFTKNGDSYQELRRVYYLLSSQKGSAANTISRFIGGVYVDRAVAGQEGATQPYTPVSLKDQKRAMAALSKYVFASNAFDAPNDLYNYLAMQRRGFNFRTPEDPKIHNQVLGYQKNILNHLLHYNTLQRISDSELYGNQYALSSVMRDLNDAIFKADIYGSVNSFRQNLQIEYTNSLIDILTGKQSDKYTNNAKSMALYNLNTIRTMAAPSGDIASRAHKQHLRTLIDNAIKEVK